MGPSASSSVRECLQTSVVGIALGTRTVELLAGITKVTELVATCSHLSQVALLEIALQALAVEELEEQARILRNTTQEAIPSMLPQTHIVTYQGDHWTQYVFCSCTDLNRAMLFFTGDLP